MSPPPRRKYSFVIIVISAFLSFLACNSSLKKIHYTSSEALAPAVSKPLVSFIVPSTLARAVLNRTIDSLRKQSEANWEAIIGVDVMKSKYNSSELINERRWEFERDQFGQDRRLRWVPIDANSTNRGEVGNGSADIRNAIIRNHAEADWVAFVDDDDSLSEAYIPLLMSGRQLHHDTDIFIFRMMSPSGAILPPYRHGHMAVNNNVGISFAARKDLFVRPKTPILFTPSAKEDFLFLHKAQYWNATIKLSCNVTYFVKQTPKYVEPHDACTMGDAFVAWNPPNKDMRTCGNCTYGFD